MRLRRIELKNFKRLVDFQAQFSPGINVVKGPLNEVGKSTLLEGIIVALFHNPKSTARELEDYVSWGSARRFQTILEFEESGNRFLLEKDFDKGTISLINDNTRESLDTFKEISKRMAELLGAKSDVIFLCSSCIRQTQVNKISSGEKEIKESLEEIVSGGKESTLASQVIQKLDDKISEMRKGLDRPAKTKGILASLKEEQDECLRKHSDARSEVSKVEAQRTELVAVNNQLAQVKDQYENAMALLDKNKLRRDIEASIKDLKQRDDQVRERVDGINKLMTELERTEEALKFVEGFENEQQVAEFRKELDAIQDRRMNVGKDLAQRETELAEAKGNLGRRKAVGFLGSGRGIATSIIILAGGIIGTSIGPFYLLGLTILGIILLAITMWAKTDLIRDKTNILGLEGRIRQMQEALGELSRKEQELLAKAKCTTVGEFDKKESYFKTLAKKKSALEAEKRGMLGDKTIEDFQKQKREIVRNLAIEEAKLTDDLKATALSPGRYVELERNVDSLGRKRDQLEKKKMECEITIKRARFDIEHQIALEEERERLSEALKHEEKKMKVYGLASDFISKARSEILSSAGEALEKEIQKYLAIFTNGKYKQVRVNKAALEFWVYSEEKRNWAKPEELSGGAIDEFYLAFRVALVKLMFGDKKPPLILDDPFVNFDSVRLGRTLDFFKTLAPDYQIIIFTLGDSYDKVADNVILLGENVKPTIAQQHISSPSSGKENGRV
jgi:DNA repair exonuclease SbcCD ATPase subunit